MYLIPVGGRGDRHGADGEILVNFIKGRCRAGSARRDDGCTYFHGFVDYADCAVEKAVEEGKDLSVASGVIHRASDDYTVGIGKFGSCLVDNVIENATSVLTAEIASDASPDVLVPDVHSFRGHAILVKGLFHLSQCAVSAATFHVGTAVDYKNFHNNTFFIL